MAYTFSCLRFEDLTVHELYEIMALRQEVFIVEQNCPYLDADGKDPQCWHLLMRDATQRLIGYTRLLPAGVAYPTYMSIGRVVNSPSVRGQGAGKILFEKSKEMCRHLFGEGPIKIGAQAYLLDFYTSFGFESTGENYLEDGIPHVKMICA